MDKLINHPLYREDLKEILSVSSVETLRGKTFLITGATGMVGSLLIDALMYLGGVNIYAIVRNKEKAEKRFAAYLGSANFNLLTQDVTVSFPKRLTADYIVPLASNTHPLAYSLYPVETMLTNIEGAKNALDLAAECGAMVLYPSTVEIYGNAADANTFAEQSNGKLSLSTSRACYPESKRSCEAMCQSYAAERGVKVKIARLCRVFGPTMLMTDSKASSQFIIKALKSEDIVLKSEGKQYFSYVYAAEAVKALLVILLHGNNCEAYNISSEKTDVHLRDFAELCAEAASRQVVFDLPSETERKGYSVAETAILDNSKLIALGFEPKYELRGAIMRTIEILKDTK
jgi:UDP-glucuronate decarboxylase